MDEARLAATQLSLRCLQLRAIELEVIAQRRELAHLDGAASGRVNLVDGSLENRLLLWIRIELLQQLVHAGLNGAAE